MNKFVPGNSIRVRSLKKRLPNLCSRDPSLDMHRVYDMPDEFLWREESIESIIPRRVVGKVSGGTLGVILEIKDEQCSALFHGGLCGWIKEDQLEMFDLYGE